MMMNLARMRPGASHVHRAISCSASNAKFFIGGNWKCNGTKASVSKLVSDLNAGSVPSDVDVVVAPVALHIQQVLDNLKSPYQLAGQNCWTKGPGAYTGEVTAEMLVDLGVPWVIIGHSERRALCAETDDVVGIKTAHAMDAGLKVIACIGETLDQREAGDLWDVLGAQLEALKKNVSEEHWDKLVIAYEPVWAIGTGKVATPEQAQVRR
jgi:triosephosphate isomerase (TIM)